MRQRPPEILFDQIESALDFAEGLFDFGRRDFEGIDTLLDHGQIGGHLVDIGGGGEPIVLREAGAFDLRHSQIDIGMHHQVAGLQGVDIFADFADHAMELPDKAEQRDREREDKQGHRGIEAVGEPAEGSACRSLGHPSLPFPPLAQFLPPAPLVGRVSLLQLRLLLAVRTLGLRVAKRREVSDAPRKCGGVNLPQPLPFLLAMCAEFHTTPEPGQGGAGGTALA